ncbi:MAG: TonB-dependent receptor domain-containing protein [Terriglobia bacterium]
MRNSGKLAAILASIAAALVLATAPAIYAQVDTGSILGTVTDQSGAVIPNAKVSLTNEGTNFTVITTTGSSGTYTFTPVKIGDYTVTVQVAGFEKAVHTHLTVNINQGLVVNFTLKTGVVTQTVSVTSAAPALQTQNASVGQVVTSRNVNDLPLNGRNFTFLAQTVAGVNTPQADTRGNAANGAFTANGVREDQNNYLLNGIDNNSDNVDFLNGTNFVVLPPPDALSEFKVQTSDYSAEYGRAAGAILNATIKSGTNQVHGDAWEFFRNDKLDAADFFEDSGGLKKGEYRQNQFGATIGGPVVIPHVYNGRNKLFFFGDFEVLRRRQGSVFTNAVPTPLEKSSGFTNLSDVILGDTNSSCLSSGSCTSKDNLGRVFPNGTAFDPATMRPVTKGQVDPVTGLTAVNTGYANDPFYTGGAVGGMTNFLGLCPSESACKLNQIPANRIDPNALKILGLFPAPTAIGTATNPVTVNNESSNPVLNENRAAWDTRIDFNQSDKNQVFGTFSYVNDPQFIPGPFGGIADGGAFEQGLQSAKSILGAISFTHIFSPTLVNEARLGEDRLHASRFGPVGTQMGIPQQYGINGIAQVTENGGLPAISISGLNTLGSNNFLPSDEITQTTQVTDNLTKIYGKHTFKMGMEFQHIKFSTLQPAYSHGQMTYGGNFAGIGLAQFLLTPIPATVPGGVDYDGGANSILVSNFSPTDDGHNYWAAYFQDDWKVTKKLTLNLGVRWEYFGAIEENHGRQGNFVPAIPGSTAAMLYPNNGKNQQIPMNPQYAQILAKDGIALKYISNPALVNVQNDNFGPRAGVAYQATSKLVVRSGFGISYNSFENLGYGPNIGENYPFQFNISPPLLNGSLPMALNNVDGSTCSPAATLENTFSCISLIPSLVNVKGLGPHGFQYNWITPYTMSWNLTTEYELAPNTTLTVAYVGTSARHLASGGISNSYTAFQLNPNATNCGPGGLVPFPDIGCNDSEVDTQGNSYYNGLQTTFLKQFSNGLDLNANYTWSHCRSDAGDELNGVGNGGSRAVALPGYGIQGGYGDCYYIIFNVFHLSGGYQLPVGQGRHFLANARGVTDALLGGWQAYWVGTLEGGQPFGFGCPRGTSSFGCNTMIIPGIDRYGSGAPDHYLNPAAFTQPCPAPGFTQPSKCVPVSLPTSIGTPVGKTQLLCGIACVGLIGGTPLQVTAPGLPRLDFSMFKEFQLTERYRLEFRSEFFNIFNNPTFNAPGFGGNGVVAVSGSTNYTSTNFGKIGSTRFPFQDPRQIQFALKLYF